MIPKDFDTNDPPSLPTVKTSASRKRLFVVISLMLAIVGAMILDGREKELHKPEAINSVHYATGIKLDIDEVEVLNYNVSWLWFQSIDIKLSEKETERLFGYEHRHGESHDCSVDFDPVTRVLSIREMEECTSYGKPPYSVMWYPPWSPPW
jgi:hypothetical protein